MEEARIPESERPESAGYMSQAFIDWGASLNLIRAPEAQDRHWTAAYKSYIRAILSKFLVGDNARYIEDLVSDGEPGKESMMAFWIRAVTHSSKSLRSNYEVLEKVGDAVLHHTSIVYFADTLGSSATPQLLTNLDHILMSKMSQFMYAKAMDVARWSRGHPRITSLDKVSEDLFESFIGALEVTARKIGRIDLGFEVAYGILRLIFDESPFMRAVRVNKVAIESYKTEVVQLGDRMGWTSKDDKKQFVVLNFFNLRTGQNKARITFTPRVSAVVAQRVGAVVPSKGWTGYGRTKEESEESAYRKVLRFYNDNGINSEVANALAWDRQVNAINNVNATIYESALAKARASYGTAFKRLEFQSQSGLSDNVGFTMLVAVTTSPGGDIRTILSLGFFKADNTVGDVNSSVRRQNTSLRKFVEVNAQVEALREYVGIGNAV
jgi:hypothetical protein